MKPMKETFGAKMMSIHFTERDRWEGKPLYKAIVDRCLALGLSGATVYRAVEGFGASARIYHDSSLSISADVPIMVTIIDSEESILRLLPYLDQIIAGGLIATSTVEVIRYAKT